MRGVRLGIYACGNGEHAKGGERMPPGLALANLPWMTVLFRKIRAGRLFP